ncbi:hypothetical protein F0562_024436 [Nyssa sinensis]|uniref:Uncharacterized protein n=1 Tax=Nyssa sinensis TaxID=561372 RepID=A0A5J5BBS1_9ASTE|nr:hypothetical protein F0562_024436 [Nyssa sinensis]
MEAVVLGCDDGGAVELGLEMRRSEVVMERSAVEMGVVVAIAERETRGGCCGGYGGSTGVSRCGGGDGCWGSAVVARGGRDWCGGGWSYDAGVGGEQWCGGDGVSRCGGRWCARTMEAVVVVAATVVMVEGAGLWGLAVRER